MALRVTLRRLGRPWGPLCSRTTIQREAPSPTESEMARRAAPSRLGDMRELYKKANPAQTGITGIPRDVGELPRNYALKILFFNQPCRTQNLWAVAKDRDDCPLDSQRHLREVLKVARLQNWVYCEKNQTDGQWYWHVHKRRSAQVQAMAVAENAARLQQEAEASAAVDAAQRQDAERSSEAQEVTMRRLHAQLVANVATIAEHDPAVLDKHAFARDGGVDFLWYRAPAQAAADQ